MAENSDGIEHSDVTVWGIAAIAFAAVAVLSSSLGTLLPQSVWVGLHANRLEGGNLNQLRAEVTQLRDQQLVMRRQATQLRSRLIIAERARSDVGQRVGALEASIPLLLEAVPAGTEIDRGLFTAAIGTPGEGSLIFEAEGGSVSVVRRPLFEDGSGPPDLLQSLPPALEGTSAVGAPPALDGPPAGVAYSSAAERQIVASLTPETPEPEADPIPAPEITSLALVEASAELAMPTAEAPRLTQTDFGIAIGGAIALDQADALWRDLSGKIGTLLLGLEPAVSDPLNDGSNRIVMGPISDYAQAEMLCLRIIRTGIECLPVQFEDSKAFGTR